MVELETIAIIVSIMSTVLGVGFAVKREISKPINSLKDEWSAFNIQQIREYNAYIEERTAVRHRLDAVEKALFRHLESIEGVKKNGE